MKKLITILLCLLVALALVGCPSSGLPSNGDYTKAQESFDAIQASTDKAEIEKTVKDVFGVTLSLPAGEEYSADKMKVSGSSMYVILVTGADVDAEEYYRSVKSSFGKWTADDGSETFSYETEKVAYGVTIEDERSNLTIVFSITDKELLGDLISTPAGFCDAIKKVSGIAITLPSSVTSIGLADLRNDGAHATYSGMLVGNGGSINKAQFDELVSSLDAQLVGYVKTVEGGSTDMSVIWTNASDSTKYFEAEYYEFDGTPMASLSFNYMDKSLLTPWPSARIDQVVGAATGIPAYNGEYSDLTVEYDEEYPDTLTITLEDATEDELNAWLEGLSQVGYMKIGTDSEYGEVYWSKMINDTTFIEVNGWYSDWYNRCVINIYREVLENVVWPTAQIAAQLGDKAAAKIPSMASAPRRTFEVYDENYRDIYVMNVIDEQLFNDYCAALESNGLTEFYSSAWDSYKQYEYVWDDYDRLEVTIYYEELDDAGQTYISLSFEYTPYEFFLNVPENLKMVYSVKTRYSSTVEETTVVKIGEDWYLKNDSYIYFYKHDPQTKTWTQQYAYIGAYGNGEISWRTGDTYDRYEFDESLMSRFESANVYNEDLATWPEDYTKGGTKTVLGKSCVEYKRGERYTYWVNEETGITFEYLYSWESNGETQTDTTTVSVYDTTVTSFADAGVTADMLPTE